MTREYRLSFCKVCNNRERDFEKGIICGLTKELANFDESCKDFTGDPIEVKKLIQNKENERKLMAEIEKSGATANNPIWIVIRIIGIILALGLAIVRMMR